MTAITLPNAGIKSGYQPLETAWGADMNRNLRVLDALVQCRAIDKDLTAPPGSPASGDVYIVAGSPTGDWAGHAGAIAIWCEGDDITATWIFVTPKAGWRVYVADEPAWYLYSGTSWGIEASAGVTKYTEAFGDGASGSFTINHGLGTRDVHVTVYRNSTPWETIACTIGRTDANTVSLSGFSGTPSTDQYIAVVSK